MAKLTGGCQCRAVRYEIEAAPFIAAHCQCTDCKRASGAGHMTSAAFLEVAVDMKGTLTTYSSRAGSGATVSRQFCSTCGGRIAYRTPNVPGVVFIAAGSLDDPAAITPTMAIHDAHHAAWDHLDPALPRFQQGPPRRP